MIWNIFGWAGVFLLLVAYFVLVMGKLNATSKLYIWMNLSGGLLMVANTVYLGAYPSAISNGFWVAITLLSLARVRT